MSDIETLDIKEFVTNALINVFDTMFSMDVAILNGDVQILNSNNQIVGSVSFAGDVVGSVAIFVSEGFARIITAAMLDMEVAEVEGDEEVNDVIGELCNMVGGDLKSRLCDSGFPCNLSIPAITCGNDFKIESKGWMRKERLGFKHREHSALVEVYLKNSQ